LESELADDTVDGAFADLEFALSEFLSNDFGACLRIQESVADDLTDKFLSSTIFGFGTSFITQQGLGTLFQEEVPELEVTLTTESELGSGAVDAFGTAFTLYEHGELKGDFVVIGNGEGAEFTLDALLKKLNGNHRDLLKSVPRLV
jgi:hypothetical protein